MSRDDVDAHIFFGVETDKFPFPPAPEGAEERYGSEDRSEDTDEAYFVDHLDSSDLWDKGVQWFKMNAYHEHDGEKKYIGIKIAHHCNCYDRATEIDLDQFEAEIRIVKEQWKILFPDVPGRLFLITEVG